MLIRNGRSILDATVSYYGLDEPYYSNEHSIIFQTGGIPQVSSIPVGYGADGIAPAIHGGSMSSRIGLAITFSGVSPINQGIGITASGLFISFSGMAGLAALVNMTASGLVITFSGSAGIYGVASMNAQEIITFSGTAGIGGLYSISASDFIAFTGSAVTHSLAHLVTTESTGTMTEATITAAVWASVDGSSVVKLLGNNVTRVGNVITIYEDDGLAIWRQFDLTDGGRVLV